MGTRLYIVSSGILFALVATAHLLRILFELPVYVAGYGVPIVMSWVAFAVSAMMASWALHTTRADREDA